MNRGPERTTRLDVARNLFSRRQPSQRIGKSIRGAWPRLQGANWSARVRDFSAAASMHGDDQSIGGSFAQSRPQLLGRHLALPPADDHGGNAVADEIGERATFAHETIDADQQGEGLDGNTWNRGQR